MDLWFYFEVKLRLSGNVCTEVQLKELRMQQLKTSKVRYAPNASSFRECAWPDVVFCLKAERGSLIVHSHIGGSGSQDVGVFVIVYWQRDYLVFLLKADVGASQCVAWSQHLMNC